MAVGVGAGFDLSKLEAQFAKLDKQLEKLMAKGKNFEKNMNDIFNNMGQKGLTNFANQLGSLRKNIVSFGKQKVGIKWDSEGLQKYINDINRLIYVIQYVQKETKKQGIKGVSISGLRKEVKEAQELLRLVKQAEKEMSKTAKNRQQTYSGAIRYSNNVKTLEQERQAVINLEAAREKLKKTDANYAAKLNSLNEAIQRHKKNIEEASKTDKQRAEEAQRNAEKIIQSEKRAYEERARLYRQQSQKKNQTYEGALAFSSSANTINRQILAVKNLEAARNKLSKTDADYANKLKNLNDRIREHEKNINRATSGARELQEKHRGLMDISGQLQRRLALVFSVSQITGYINKIIQVRGEFELQQKSLQVLIGSLDEANEIWDKTVALAVKSPFTVKNLVTYTKQLAAYRVESEKLYDTTKMLADVSAGLGVDMQRLILAYGQVKAVNFLRGTELRQFTEAGVNMLDELSAYFSEIEGKAVSVGDVFDRISKRRVSFEAVDAVFKRITGEGGVFYQMQEKQSQTLRGMMMNLRDSIDLMMNDIGKSNDGVLKDTVGLIRSIINEWRSLEPILKTAGTTFLAYFSISNLSKIKTAATAMMAAFTAHPVTLITTAVVALVAAIYNARNATSKFNAAILEVEQNAIKSLEESIGLYKKLVDIINDATKTQVERNKAYDQLKQKFTEILPDQLLEIEYVKSLSGNYKEAETAMFNYYNAKAKAQKKDRIEQLYTSELEDTDIPELQKSIRDFIEGDERIEERAKIKLKSGIVGVVNSLVDDVKSGKINATLEEFNKEIIERLSAYAGFNEKQKEAFGVLFESENSIWTKRRHNIEDIIETLQRYKQSMQSISGLSYGTYEEEKAGEIVNKELENVNKSTELFKKVAGLYENYTQIVEKSGTTIEEQQKAITDSVSQMLEKLKKDAPAYGNYMEGVFKRLEEAAKKGKFAYSEALQSIESEMYAKRGEKGFEGGLGQLAFDQAKMKANSQKLATDLIDNVQENLNRKAEELEFTAFQKAVTEGAKSIASKFDIDQDLFAQFIPKQNQALSTLQEGLKGFIEQRENEIKELETSLKVGMETLSYDVFDQTKQKLDELKKSLPALKEFGKFLGIDEKDKGSGGRSNSLYDERIKVIDDLNKKYRELIATVGHSTAVEEAFASYKDAFAEAYKGISWIPSNVRQMSAAEFVEKVLNFPSEAALVEFLDELAKEPMKVFEKIKVELAKGKYVFDEEVRDIKKKDKEILDAIDDMFGNYEISLELEKLNIPSDLAKKLFGVESINLKTIRENIEKELEIAKATGGKGDQVKAIEERLKKVKDLEDKELKERLKRYSQFLVKGQSEAVRLKIEELRELAKLEEDYQNKRIEKPYYDLTKKGIQDEYKRKQKDLVWDEFTESDTYIRMFEDLEDASTSSIRKMIDKIEGLKDSLKGLDPKNAKEMVDALEKLKDEDAERNPFRAMSENAKEFVDWLVKAKKLKDELKQKEEDDVKAQERLNNAREEYANASIDYEAISKNATATQEQKDAAKDRMEAAAAELKSAQGVAESTKEGVENTEEMRDNLREGALAFAKSIRDIADDVQQYTDAIAELVGHFSGDAAESISGVGGGISSLLGGAGNLASGLASGNPLAIIQGASDIIGGIKNIKGAFDALHDKKNEREIKKQQELVERLGKQYEKLEKQIDNAYKQEDLKSSFDEAQSNMNAQIAAYDKMIAQEEDKKKSDENKIKEWKEAQEEIRERQEELLHSQVENLGGTYDYKSATREFVDAWVDAFKETGNGLKGLENNFSDFWKNIVLNQVVMGGASKIIEPLLNEVNKALEEDFKIDGSENAAINATADEVMSLLDDFMKKAYEQYGDALTGAAEAGELTGLQRGIQGITESQADILAAYLNSIRYYVSENSNYLSQIAANYDTSIENPMLPQLKTIADQTSAINELLQSVRYNGGDGVGIRVYMP